MRRGLRGANYFIMQRRKEYLKAEIFFLSLRLCVIKSSLRRQANWPTIGSDDSMARTPPKTVTICKNVKKWQELAESNQRPSVLEADHVTVFIG